MINTKMANESTIGQNRMHRAVSALAYQLLADGKVAAFEYACANQAPHWIDISLTPEQALERSLEGFEQPDKERRSTPAERADAARMAKICRHPAAWDKAAQKEAL